MNGLRIWRTFTASFFEVSRVASDRLKVCQPGSFWIRQLARITSSSLETLRQSLDLSSFQVTATVGILRETLLNRVRNTEHNEHLRGASSVRAAWLTCL